MGKNGALAKRSGGQVIDLKVVKSCMNDLAERRGAISELNGDIRKMIGESSNSPRAIMARMMQKVIPRRVQQILPNGVTKFIADETDMLERVETQLRENTNGAQDTLMSLVGMAKTTREEMVELARDITQARQENWDARALQDYIAEKSGIPLYAEVSDLFDKEFGVLTDEERELRKDELLTSLMAMLKVGDANMAMMGKVCGVVSREFNVAMVQFLSYLKAYKPMIVFRDAAKQITEMNASMFIAKGALDLTFVTALDAITLSMDVIQQAGKFSISSPATVKMLEDGKAHLEEKLAAFDKARAENIRRLRGMPLESQSLIEASQPIDAEVAAEEAAAPTA